MVAFQEVSDYWHGVLAEEPFRSALPHRLAWPPASQVQGDAFSLVLASRLPLEAERVHPQDNGSPFLEAVVRVGGERVHLVAAHPPRPGRAWRMRSRNRQLGGLMEVVDWGPSSVLLGDLNMNGRSPSFTRLLEATGLRDSRRGFGRQPTWRTGPAILLPGPLRGWTPRLWTTLDHILVGPSIGVVDRWVGPDVGSDHWPVLATLRVRFSGMGE